ncbi:DUF6591 domain-containing protein [Lachnospiraceae bacterium C1.1]|nr:hypothetical protein [Lachnospiraceae bacterium C1.1]
MDEYKETENPNQEIHLDEDNNEISDAINDRKKRTIIVLAVVVTVLVIGGMGIYINKKSDEKIADLKEKIAADDSVIDDYRNSEIENARNLVSYFHTEENNNNIFELHNYVIEIGNRVEDKTNEWAEYIYYANDIRENNLTLTKNEADRLSKDSKKCGEEWENEFNELSNVWLQEKSNLGDKIYALACMAETVNTINEALEGKRKNGNGVMDYDDRSEGYSSMQGIRPQFKEALDTYEKFFDEYCSFLDSYDSSDLSMLGKYISMMSQFSKTMKALEELKTDDLSSEELAYYLDVMLRISNKLSSLSVN